MTHLILLLLIFLGGCTSSLTGHKHVDFLTGYQDGVKICFAKLDVRLEPATDPYSSGIYAGCKDIRYYLTAMNLEAEAEGAKDLDLNHLPPEEEILKRMYDCYEEYLERPKLEPSNGFFNNFARGYHEGYWAYMAYKKVTRENPTDDYFNGYNDGLMDAQRDAKGAIASKLFHKDYKFLTHEEFDKRIAQRYDEVLILKNTPGAPGF